MLMVHFKKNVSEEGGKGRGEKGVINVRALLSRESTTIYETEDEGGGKFAFGSGRREGGRKWGCERDYTGKALRV